MSRHIPSPCFRCKNYPLCRKSNPNLHMSRCIGYVEMEFDAPNTEWAECLCDEIDPADVPCMVCATLDEIADDMRKDKQNDT